MLLGAVSGCTHTWDDVTSKEFKMANLWSSPPPPMTVLEKSTDGYARAKALNKLHEPSQGADRDKAINALQTAALSDRDPLCRMAAVRTLGRYKDPRAAKVLSEVYLGNPGLNAENNAMIRQQALAALETSAPNEARQLFIQAARQPAGSLTATASKDRQEILDERLTAIRALAKYPQSDSVETLVHLLEKEKDVAIRTCAHESLKATTKRDIPADGKAWREFVATGKEPARQPFSFANFKKSETPPPSVATDAKQPSLFDKISNWVRPEKESDPMTEPIRPAAPLRSPTAFPTAPRPSPNLAPPVPNLPESLPSSNQVQNNRPGGILPVNGSMPVVGSPPGVVSSNRNAISVTPAAPVPAGARYNAQGELIVPVPGN